MKQRVYLGIVVLFVFVILTGCSGPQPHLFVFKYNQAEALTACRISLAEVDYKIAMFDVAAGVINTEPQKFISDKDSSWVDHQIIITITHAHEMRVRVTPNNAIEYRDEIMEPIVKKFEEAGIHAKYIPPPRPRTWHRPPPPFRRP